MDFNDEISTLFDNANNIRSYIIDNQNNRRRFRGGRR
jgi:hypothetical protein